MNKIEKTLLLSLAAVVLAVSALVQPLAHQPTVSAQTSDSLRKQKEHKKLYKNYRREKKLPALAAEATGDFEIIEGVPQKVFQSDAPRIQPQDFLSRLLCKSDAVVVGTIKDKNSDLTEDDNFIFTDYELAVEDVLKDNAAHSIQPATQITVTRPGGTLQLSGRTVTAIDEGFKPLQPGSRYLLFLQFVPATGAYTTSASAGSYQLKNQRLIKLTAESLPPDFEAGQDAAAFVDSLRQAANGACHN